MNPSPDETLFAEALARPAADRAAYLDQACGDDHAQRSRLESLLSAVGDAEHFMEHSPMEPATAAKRLVPGQGLPEEKSGDWIGHYRLLQKIGEGGCGEVWMAEQEEPVRRRVALKVIKLGMDTKAVIARFEAERQALALMDHPNIAKVHDAGSTATGRPFFVMELVRGLPITKYCDEHQLPPTERLELFIKVCQAVQHAHQKGIIHRDLKPSNILVTVNDGQATPKIIDFGIAKATQGKLTDATLFTAFEQFIGTPAYMSPEQAEMSSVDIDTRSDIYSLGVLLYELLTGRPPFDPRSFASSGIDQIRQLIREKEPPRPSTRWNTLGEAEQSTSARLRGTLPAQLATLLRGDLDWIVMRCLEKDRLRRYETASALAADIQRHLRHEPVVARPPSTLYLLQKLFRRHRLGFAATGIVAAVVFIGALVSAHQATRALRAERLQHELREAAQQAQTKEAAARLAAAQEQERNTRQRLVRQHVLPEIIRLIEADDIAAAFAKAVEAEKDLPDDPALTALWPRISQVVSISTTPPGADVYFKEYRKPDSPWVFLGKAPLKDVRLARGFYRWQVMADGYAACEQLVAMRGKISFTLDRPETVAPGMVRVEGIDRLSLHAQLTGLQHLPRVQLGSFLIDKFEVTNRQFREFIDHGGYSNARFWREPFVKHGKELTWSEAMAEFRDATGRPGPATWKNGTFPEGEADFPVAGVSWFEAAAYAESVGKRLPTIYHWAWAAAPGWALVIVPLSNFSGKGPTRVGSHQGMSPSGTYDMAGNVKEWCWNQAGADQRYILGGGAREPDYMFYVPDSRSPFDRSAGNGFRCIRLLATEALAERVNGSVLPPTRNYANERPVGDEVFQIYRSLYSYDRTALDSRIEASDDSSERWRREKVSFNAAYGNERMAAYLFLPKHAPPPYQTVVLFPGAGAITTSSSEKLDVPPYLVPVLESGRAVIWPIYKGTYERRDGLPTYCPTPTSSYREHVIRWSQDLGRAIDYLETRKDIQSDKLAFYGSSWGGALGGLLPALENRRLKASVLAGGGFHIQRTLPEADQINFTPRITIPTLMFNGRHDSVFPLETSQLPMFNLLGTPKEHKRHVLYDAGHGPFPSQSSKEILDWLDKYLGPVR